MGCSLQTETLIGKHVIEKVRRIAAIESQIKLSSKYCNVLPAFVYLFIHYILAYMFADLNDPEYDHIHN